MKKLLPILLSLLLAAPSLAILPGGEYELEVTINAPTPQDDEHSTATVSASDGSISCTAHCYMAPQWGLWWDSDDSYAHSQAAVIYTWTWNDGGDPNNIAPGARIDIDYGEGYVVGNESWASHGDPYGRSHGSLDADGDASVSGYYWSMSCNCSVDVGVYGDGSASYDYSPSSGIWIEWDEGKTEEDRYALAEVDGERVDGGGGETLQFYSGSDTIQVSISADATASLDAGGFNIDGSMDSYSYADLDWSIEFSQK